MTAGGVVLQPVPGDPGRHWYRMEPYELLGACPTPSAVCSINTPLVALRLIIADVDGTGTCAANPVATFITLSIQLSQKNLTPIEIARPVNAAKTGRELSPLSTEGALILL